MIAWLLAQLLCVFDLAHCSKLAWTAGLHARLRGRRADDVTREQRLEELATLVGVWRSSRCTWPSHSYSNSCSGENHREDCSVQLAAYDVIAAHNALGAPGMPGKENTNG